jgi:serine/threonine-protein kinase
MADHAPAGHCPRCLLLRGLDSDPPDLDPGSDGQTIDLPGRPGSVLETIAATIGAVPRVMLRDTAVGETPSPVIRPTIGQDASIRYRIDGEIARGGMGAILKGRDPDLGRDVAIKVLREDLRDNADLVRRFVEEAQIGGQLQHPGVVPIYELGTFADHRPFFSMKLVKGQTLADLLAARPTPVDDLPRFLSIFAAIAQTMAYSHTRGVVHRDLKPSNVMVGSFGEVQVMDWGLAKVLPRGGVINDAKDGKEQPTETPIATARSDSDQELSHAGSVLGTPSYMPPEQARGEIDLIDERADVFALGSILCEILTGKPGFTGRSSAEILRKATRGDTADALKRLDGCGAEAELIALVRDCLAAEPEDRPHDANVVAERITSYLGGVQERVQAAERERAVAVARAVEERRRRKVQLALAASVLAFTTLGGLSATYYLQQRAERARQRTEQAAATDRVVGRAVTLCDQARAHPEDLPRWQVALAAVQQAEAARDENALPRLLALRAEIQAGLDASRRDKALLDRLVDIRSAEADDPDGSVTDAAYADAFREAGIDLANLPPADVGAKIKARPASVAVGLAGALDDLARIRREKREDAAGAARSSAAARDADPDPWRIELRSTLDQADKAARLAGLQALARKADFEKLGPISLQLLGSGLYGTGDGPLAESVLRAAQQRHPRDVWVNYTLGAVLERRSRLDDAIRFYTAARSIRPETAHELAHALETRGHSEEALAVFRDLKKLRPGNARHLGCLGRALQARGLSREANEALGDAVAAFRETIRRKPDYVEAHVSLGRALEDQGKPDQAIAEYREAIRLKPDYALAHCNLGNPLMAMKKLDEAIAEYREAIRLRPGYGEARSNLGNALRIQGKVDQAIAEYREAIRLTPDLAEAHLSLGALLGDRLRDYPAAESEYREAIRLKPDYAEAHSNLGNALHTQGKLDEAIAAYREAIRLRPDLAMAHYGLGAALYDQGKLGQATAGFREAIRLQPDNVGAHYGLGIALNTQGKLDEAVAAYREAIRLQPDFAEAHCDLGNILRRQADYAGALEMLRKGHELGSRRPGWPNPSALWLAQTERELALSARLPAILRGEDKAGDNSERLTFARLAQGRKQFAASARLWAEAFEADPASANDLKAYSRYSAAGAAAQAGAGQGKDEPPPDEAARRRFRTQARDWLRADLGLRAKQLDTGEVMDRYDVSLGLQHWKHDPQLAGIREPDALASLPETEQKECQALWADVEALLNRARGQAP